MNKSAMLIYLQHPGRHQQAYAEKRLQRPKLPLQIGCSIADANLSFVFSQRDDVGLG